MINALRTPGSLTSLPAHITRSEARSGAASADDMGGAGGKALPPVPPTSVPQTFNIPASGASFGQHTRRRGSPPVVTVITALHLPLPPADVFAFHADVRNLPRLTPGPARILSAPTPTHEGDLQVIELGAGPLRRRWEARIVRFDPPHTVVDQQERGPFRFWRHTHTVIPDGRGALLVDIVEFRLLPGPVGRLLDSIVVKPVLRLLFAERHRRTHRLLGRGWSRA